MAENLAFSVISRIKLDGCTDRFRISKLKQKSGIKHLNWRFLHIPFGQNELGIRKYGYVYEWVVSESYT